MSPQQALLATEVDLARSLRAYIQQRTSNTALDDMTDDAMGAVNEALQENWSVEIAGAHVPSSQISA